MFQHIAYRTSEYHKRLIAEAFTPWGQVVQSAVESTAVAAQQQETIASPLGTYQSARSATLNRLRVRARVESAPPNILNRLKQRF